MTFLPKGGLSPRSKATVLIFLVFFLIGTPAFSDPFGYLSVKDARKAKEALATLDAAISAWSDAFERLTEVSWNARAAVARPQDSSTYETLIAAEASGVWRAGKGPSLSVLEADVRKSAARLEAVLSPRLASAEADQLKELLTLLCSLGLRLPGYAEECFEFATRSAALDTSSLRFVVKSALGVVPEEAARRFAPNDVDPATLPYGRDAGLAASAERLRTLRKAVSAVRDAATFLAVPEVSWTPEGTAKAEEAARLLEPFRPFERARALKYAAVPGLELLPAFLSGLSPEELSRWRLERGLSSRAVRVFLSASCEGAAISDVDQTAGRTALAASLAELERVAAEENLSGVALLARLTDPALRSALLRDFASVGLGAEVEEARKTLAAALEERLSDALQDSGGEGNSAEKRTVSVELRRIEASGGFFEVRLYSVSEKGDRTLLASDALASALDSVFGASGAGSAPSGIPNSVRFGILTAEDPEDPVPSEWIRAADPAAFAALTCLASRRLEETALTAGVSPRTLRGPDLERIVAVCLLRCRGLARDEDVVRAEAEAGGAERAASLWKFAFQKLESVRRAVAVYVGEGTRS